MSNFRSIRIGVLTLSLGPLFCDLSGAEPPAAEPEPVSAISPADPSSVQRGIDAAWKAGASKVVVPAGVYRIGSPPGVGAHLHFSEMKHLEIDATGATFVFTDRTRSSIEFEQCDGVTFRGATLLRDPIPFSQGEIEALASDRRSMDVRVAKGYPSDLDDRRFFPERAMAYVFDPKTRQWKPGMFDIFAERVERLGPDRFRFHLRAGMLPANAPVRAGDLLAWRGQRFSDVFLNGCREMRVTGVTIKSGIGFCVHEEGGEGNNYLNYAVTYGLPPEGATEAPLICCNADAFHSSRARRGPTLENCRFEGMCDDGVAIHGGYALVVEATGNKIVANTHAGPSFRPGDRLRWLNNQLAPAGEAQVVAIKPLPDYQSKGQTKLRAFKDPLRARYYEVELDKELPVRPGELIANPDANGNGFTVRDCTIRNHRGRGLFIKASNGIVEGCTIDASTSAGIVLAPDLFWAEADYSENVVLRNNIIRKTRAWGRASSTLSGALTVAAYENGKFVPLPGGHRNIKIENNRFEDNDGVNLLISSARQVEITGNKFVRPMRHPTARGAEKGVKPDALIWLAECEEVRLQQNTASDPGPFLRKLIEATKTAHGAGFETGLTRN